MTMEREQRLNNFKEEYWSIYWSEIGDHEFIWRGLSRREFNRITRFNIDDLEKEEEICRLCMIEPVEFDFDNCLAGIPSLLAGQILAESGFGSSDGSKLRDMMTMYREEMKDFQNQVSCIIHEGFPMLDIEEIEDWPMEKTLWYFSRAEYKLELRDIHLVNEEGEEPSVVQVNNSQRSVANTRDFPELKIEKQFMEGKFR